MSKKQLKEKHKNLEINLVDIVSKLDPSDTGKYTKFLTNFLIKRIEETSNPNELNIRKGSLGGRIKKIPSLRNTLLEGFKIPSGSNEVENLFIDYLINMYSTENVENLFLFNQHLENDRIPNGYRDISNYENWDDINKQVSIATINYEKKRLEKEVKITLETEEWLAIRPLTMSSSLIYGSATKWCTASKNNHEYFYRYSSNGVLNYVINKLNGDKYGVYYDKDGKEFSIWDSSDKRVDSIESSIPQNIILQIYLNSKLENVNYEYFSDSEKENSSKYYQGFEEEYPVYEMAHVEIQNYVSPEPNQVEPM